jgi:hypothetical protein
MKNLFKLFILTAVLISSVGCKKYLDINSDPDTPQFPDASSVFPAMLSAIPRGTQYDARYISKYIQNFGQNANDNVWDLHGHQGYLSGSSDVGGDIWRQCYYGLGANLNYIIKEGVKKGQWDYVGAAYSLKALMFQMTTDMHGEIIFKDAFKENTSSFAFDSQESVYKGVDSLCRIALSYLNRTDLSTSNSALSKGDFIYSGDIAKWIKFTNGILARNFHRLTNKADYKADSVIYYADLAMASGADDFVVPFDASKNDDSNFFGTFRDNLGAFRQSKFIVAMLDGTTLAGVSNPANRDPRMPQMLSASGDTTNGNGGYRGVDVGVADPAASTSSARVASPFGDATYGNPSAARFDPSRGKYLFRDKVVHPIMTYSEMQFMKAEASFRKSGATATAYNAYINGINGHFAFINRATFPRSNTPLYTNAPISAAQQTAYMNSANVKKTAGSLTMTDIMLQKYIALWGWGFFETWVDMRRFHYTDVDAATATPVYKGYTIPSRITAINPANGGKLATRVRPRFNSEYVWNFPQLELIGATLPDYHVKEMWFSQRP